MVWRQAIHQTKIKIRHCHQATSCQGTVGKEQWTTYVNFKMVVSYKEKEYLRGKQVLEGNFLCSISFKQETASFQHSMEIYKAESSSHWILSQKKKKKNVILASKFLYLTPLNHIIKKIYTPLQCEDALGLPARGGLGPQGFLMQLQSGSLTLRHDCPRLLYLCSPAPEHRPWFTRSNQWWYPDGRGHCAHDKQW